MENKEDIKTVDINTCSRTCPYITWVNEVTSFCEKHQKMIYPREYKCEKTNNWIKESSNPNRLEECKLLNTDFTKLELLLIAKNKNPQIKPDSQTNQSEKSLDFSIKYAGREGHNGK